MTTIYMDGFDHYGVANSGAAAMTNGSWAQTQVSNSACGPGIPSFGARTGTYALCGISILGSYRFVLPSTLGNMFMSFGFACDTALPSNNFRNQLCSFRNSSNGVIANLWVQSTGVIALADSSNNVLAQTQGPVVVADNWHFIELNFNQSGGAFTLRIDDPTGAGTAAIAATGLTLTGAVAQLTFLDLAVASFGFVTTWLDDLFIRDTSGSVNQGWIGDRRVATLLADGDTTTAGWSANRYTKLGTGILNITGSTFGNSAYIDTASATSLDIGNSDFTLESFVRFQSLPTGSNKTVIFGRWNQLSNQRSYEFFLGSQSLNGGSLCWQTSTDGTGSTITQSIVYPWTPSLDTWYHMAVVRTSGQLLLFVNGQQLGLPISDSTTYFAGTSRFSLGAETNASGLVSGTNLVGWMDETRFTNGFARYTSNFTPTTVEFPRGVSDPEWANVVYLAGYDTLIQDESSFSRTMTAHNGAVQQTTHDGVAVGVWPVIGKSAPDDNTFIEASFISATSILTLGANPSNGNTVTVGTKDGTNAAVYKFVTTLASAYDVLIDTTTTTTLQNLYNAINAGPGIGTKYGTGTLANFDVNALQLPGSQMSVQANVPGTVGNSIATTKSGITGSWTGSTLSGGLDIPGPSNFKVQRLPPTTTIVSAVQITMRGFKSDAGVGTINSAFVGALGGTTTGPTHSLTVSPIYYNDVYEIDPDTSGPISPTTIANGSIQINRDT